MPADYTKLWEAWVGGWGETSGLTPGQDVGAERIKDFYSQVVGPAWGGEYQEEQTIPFFAGEITVPGSEGFGDVYEQYISAFDTQELERAEREFRMSIGDPYAYGEDPFAWERISRMQPDQAQTQLEAELFGQGKRLGGETGAEYGTGMATSLEQYTSGIAGTRESLTHEGLEGGQGLASGTSGAVLRSGEGISVAEDVLIEAYKKTKDIEAGYKEGKVGIESELETDLNTALTKYLDRIDREKGDWFDTIAGDVQRASDLNMGYEFGSIAVGEDWGEEYGAGLEYQEEQWFMEDEACGIGEVRNEEGICTEASELGLEYDEYGLLCPSGKIDCAGNCGGNAEDYGCGCGNGKPTVRCSNGSYVCSQEDCPTEVGDGLVVPEGLEIEEEEEEEIISGCMDSSACNYDPGATEDDGSCVHEGENFDCDDNCKVGIDCAGVCGGTAEADECGVCGGLGPQVTCIGGGDMVCNEIDCPATDVDPEGETYVNCTEEYGEAYSWNPELGQCVSNDFDTGSCHQPHNTCLPGTCCCDNGICTPGCCDDAEDGGGAIPGMEDVLCPPGKVRGPNGKCKGVF